MHETMNEVVSIIIPVYKVEKWLNKCVSSIVDQTYRDIEIILVDDGSPDRCAQMCDEWREKDSRIRVIHKENGGLSDARNVGLDHATGNWIMFVDSDDFVHADMVRIVLGIAQKNLSDLVAFEYQKVEEDCNEVQTYLTGIYEEIYEKDQLLREFAKNGKGSMIACNKLYHRKLWDSVRFPIGKTREDEYVIVDILEQVQNATVIDSKLYYYRQRQGSIMASVSKKAEYDALEAFGIRCNRLRNDRELYLSALNLYLGQLITIYLKDDESKNDIKRLFRKKMKVSFKYIYWKTMILYLMFFVSPKIYVKFIELRGKLKNG